MNDNSTKNAIEIVIAGDFIPNDKTLQLIRENKAHTFAPEVARVVQQSDLALVNLETPLTNKKDPINKLGLNFMSHPESVGLITELGFNAVTLANNHILDQGEQGVLETIKICERVGLKTVGAGLNLEAARKPLEIEVKGKKLGIINFCEQEFSIASDNSAGANRLDLIDNYRDIIALRKKVDYLLVIFHGGKEYYHLPLPEVKKNCEFFIDCGADAVIGHHSHYYGGYSYYRGKPIFYSLGNFFSQSKLKDKNLYRSYVLKLKLEKRDVRHSIFPIEIDTAVPEIRLSSKTKKFFGHLEEINKTLNDSEKLTQYWKDIICNKGDVYYNILFSRNPFFYKVRKYLGLKKRPTWHQCVNLLNMLRCKSHYEFLRMALSGRINKKTD